jgi:hypothetical protein
VICDEVADFLPALAEPQTVADERVAGHVGHCLRCQARIAQYRRLRRAASELRHHTLPIRLGAVATVLDAVALDSARIVRGGRRAWGAVALAASAAGAVVIGARARRARLAG